MKIPTIKGIIDRRILINYTVDEDIVRKIIPSPLEIREGVFIPRRDSSSLFNSMAGGRFFPGKHFHAKYTVKEEQGKFQIAFTSSDNTSISIKMKPSFQRVR